MAKVKSISVSKYRPRKKVSRKGVHSKNNPPQKKYRGQGK